MKPIRVFVYPSHCDGKHIPGIDYVRVIRPMEELQKQPGFEVTIFDYRTMKHLDWRKIAKQYDILFLNYTTHAWGYAMMGLLMIKEGKKIVFDIDDLIWEVQPDNSAYSSYLPGGLNRAAITDIIARGCDYVTCTNLFLKHGIAQYTGRDRNDIKVIPNYIDLDLYRWHKRPVDNYEVTIGYFGSSSHFNDLVTPGFVGGLERLMKENPRVRFFTIGAMIQEIKKKFGSRYQTDFGDHDIYKWVKMIPKVLGDVDIFVAPLVDITYARAKSGIKFLEYSSMKIPGCYQNIRQYQEVVKHGENGYLCETTHDWYFNLKQLCDSVELRREIGNNAYETVKQDWTIQGNVQKYIDLFQSIV
jgi:glycosyltransferase involved in cell wall biosynthesis